jgi:hypothetical protein
MAVPQQRRLRCCVGPVVLYVRRRQNIYKSCVRARLRLLRSIESTRRGNIHRGRQKLDQLVD